MHTHMIVGRTAWTKDIIKNLKSRNERNIIVEDEDHIGLPERLNGVTYMSPEQSLEVRMYTENIVYHFCMYARPRKR